MRRFFEIKPAEFYRLYIDETGSRFSAGSRPAQEEGRVVGILMTGGADSRLKPRIDSAFHAAEATPSGIDKVLAQLDSGDVAAIGLRLTGSHAAGGDAWLAMVLEVVQWALRLIPLPTPANQCWLTVHVEQRAQFTPNFNLDAATAAIREEFGRARPDRATRLDLRKMSIETSATAPCLGYADALAYVFGGYAPESANRRAALALDRNLLFDPVETRRLWDVISLGDAPAPAGVASLLARQRPYLRGTYESHILGELTGFYSARAQIWQALLAWVNAHLDSGAVNLPAVTRQVAFLERTRPPEATLTDRLETRAALLCAQLEVANHSGETDTQVIAELDSLAGDLVEARGDLACQLDLVRAVHHTNRFEFAEASAALSRWTERPERANLALRGRVYSSLGQHHAFQGQHEAALQEFRRALDLFEQLARVDRLQAERERLQTATYLALASLDHPGLDAASKTQAVEAVLGPLDATRVAELAGESDDASKYRHHLLVRYMIQVAPIDHRDAYIRAQMSWGETEGFPWPLICVWRAAMLWDTSDVEGAHAALMHALQSTEAVDAAPTLRFIGFAVREAARAWAPSVREDDGALDTWRATLPSAAAHFEAQRATLAPNATFTQRVLTLLPFNFR